MNEGTSAQQTLVISTLSVEALGSSTVVVDSLRGLSASQMFAARLSSLGQWSLGTKLLAVWAMLIATFQALTLPQYIVSMVLRATDFQAFHRAGQWVLGAQTTPLYPLTSFAGFSGPAADLHLCMNPPHFILALTPFAHLPLRTAYLLFCGVNVACLVATLYVLRPFLRLWKSGQAFCVALLFFGFPFVTSAMAQGTVSLPVTLCLAVVVRWDIEGRTTTFKGSLLPGLCLSLISMKPQYLVLVGIYLLVRREWRVLAIGTGATMAWFGASVAAMGIGPWLRYPRYLQIFTQQLDVFDANDPTYRWVAEQMINARGVLIRVLGFSQAGLINTLSTALLLLAVLAVAATAFRVNRGSLDPQTAWCLVLLLMACTSGHANPTDGVVLIIPAILGWTVRQSSARRSSLASAVPFLSVAGTIVSYSTLGIQHRGSFPALGLMIVATTGTALFVARTRKPLRSYRLQPSM
jgi:Glycosyltransferase family 87